MADPSLSESVAADSDGHISNAISLGDRARVGIGLANRMTRFLSASVFGLSSWVRGARLLYVRGEREKGGRGGGDGRGCSRGDEPAAAWRRAAAAAARLLPRVPREPPTGLHGPRDTGRAARRPLSRPCGRRLPLCQRRPAARVAAAAGGGPAGQVVAGLELGLAEGSRGKPAQCWAWSVVARARRHPACRQAAVVVCVVCVGGCGCGRSDVLSSRADRHLMMKGCRACRAGAAVPRCAGSLTAREQPHGPRGALLP